MVDTKFLIVTTLCYVGIFVVILVVCCCAWSRYMRNEGRVPARRTKPSRGPRRTAREPVVTQQCTPLPPPPRQYRYVGDFTDLNHQNQPIIFDPHVRPNFRHVGIQRPTYPNHYALVEDCPPRNYYPVSLATPTDTYDMDLQMDINSATYADTSQGGFSGDEFSDFQSSRYDSRHDISGVASGEGAVLSTSDVGESLKNANQNSLETNGLESETRRSTEGLKQDDSGDECVCGIPEDDLKCSTRRNSDILGDSLLVTSCSDDCNGVGITPSCSVQSLTDFNEEPEHIPLNIT
ncbi:uncharacterized protein LOC116302067 [Actinia tenebrosa]|uniref:Uncharacterized protein LOC116302067 n=1 Tax=Actinia tenebrosa TaxID=6105 RepID=A0A6P8IK87_ACTTE|nr:uncharacterized protein LOC116302067 [Actinia tenebrosa]